MKARTVEGREEMSLLIGPGFELRLGRDKENEKCGDSRMDEHE